MSAARRRTVAIALLCLVCLSCSVGRVAANAPTGVLSADIGQVLANADVGESHGGVGRNVTLTLLALVLVAVNGFFVAAEFAFVKVRGSRIQELVRQGRPFSKTARWLAERLEDSLSACQLGITIASLALGSVGEPAFNALLSPMLSPLNLSPAAVGIVSYSAALSVITALHLVVGEQAPKIFAIRNPERLALWCAVPLKVFFTLTYPLLKALNWCTQILLGWLGVAPAGHEEPHTEEEIRALLREAHVHGDLTRNEHHLINAVFEFDDMVCRRVMVPRADISFFTLEQPWASCLEQARRTRHSRYPLCDGSLDKVVGVVHIRDLIGFSADDQVDLAEFARPPKQVPDDMPISRLLRHFQAPRIRRRRVWHDHRHGDDGECSGADRGARGGRVRSGNAGGGS